MALTYATAAQNDRADAIGALLSGGSVEIRTGAKPASANSAADGTLLATVTLGTSPSASAGTVTMPDPASVNAVATGTAAHFRAKTSGGATVFDGTVTATGAGGDLTLSTTSLVSGSPVDISSFNYSELSGE